MTRYFTALITFMVVLVIAGLMFDGFDSQQGIAVTVIVSLAAAIAAYMLAPKKQHGRKIGREGYVRIPATPSPNPTSL